ncbi:MAG: hypothetical protein ABIG44_09915 [Planctomycetota bacterium]
MSSDSTNTLISEEELESAFREIEALGPTQDNIPDLDDDSDQQSDHKVVPIPVPSAVMAPRPADSAENNADTPRRRSAKPETSQSGSSIPMESRDTPNSDSTRDPAPSKGGIFGRLFRLIWKRSPQERRQHARAKAPVPTHDEEHELETSTSSRPGLLYSLVDGLLDVINRPFARLSPETRRIIGLVGTITLLLSVLAPLLLPLIMPRNDAFTFLEQKRIEVMVAPPLKVTTSVGDSKSTSKP